MGAFGALVHVGAGEAVAVVSGVAHALEGVGAVYVSYYPDLAVPGAVEATGDFSKLAVAMGVHRVVLLAGRGEAEAERAEEAVRDSGADLTIVRSTWFMQNFSEGDFLGQVLSGEVTLPAGDMVEPFVDADDIADVAVGFEKGTTGFPFV